LHSEGKSPVDINYLDQITPPETTPQTTNSTTNSTTTKSTNENVTTKNTTKRDVTQTSTESGTKSETSYDNPRLYYYRAYESLDNLIEIRREWDKYLVPPGTGGSRIPQHFIAPPQAPDGSLWKNFIKKPKNSTKDDTNGEMRVDSVLKD